MLRTLRVSVAIIMLPFGEQACSNRRPAAPLLPSRILAYAVSATPAVQVAEIVGRMAAGRADNIA